MKKYSSIIIGLLLSIVMLTPTMSLVVEAQAGGTTPAVPPTTADEQAKKAIDKIFQVQTLTGNEGATGNVKKLSGTVTSNKQSTFADVFAGIIKILTGLAVIMTFIGVTVAGIIFLFSDGEEPKTTKARTILIYIAIGDLIIMASYGIVRAITNINPLS